MKPRTLSPELQRIAHLAAVNKKMVFTTLAHHITVDMLRHAYELTRKDGAPGVDGETWKTYGDNLESNLTDLHERLKNRRYVATPVEQHSRLTQKLRGHYQYYGLRCNYRSLVSLFHHTLRTWRKWLSRRSQKARIAWEKFREIIKRFPLPLPKIIHQDI